MAFKGYITGVISLILGVFFFAFLIWTMIVPGTTLATGAVMVGIGTIISVIFLAVALLADK